MPVITISRGSYSRGREVAEKVADKLGYQLISREAMLRASEEYNVPEIKLVRAIHDAPSILDRLSHKKEKYIAYIRAALLQQFSKDNTVYHGLAGHFFVRDISHVLKVRILSDTEDRIKTEMARESISRAEALRTLKKDDEERRKWSLYLYGIDKQDPSLYDLVIHIKTIQVDDAVDIICHTAGLTHFQATDESTEAIKDLTLAAAVKAAIIDIDYNCRVTAAAGSVNIEAVGTQVQRAQIAADIRSIVEDMPGVREVLVDVKPMLPLSE